MPSDRLTIVPGIELPLSEIEMQFVRSSGPGGQNVNKVASAVQLRFDVRRSPSLSAGVKSRAEKRAGNLLTNDGVLVMTADRFRTQALNRKDALDRLVTLLAASAYPPKRRVPTKPTMASKRRRTDAKTRRGAIKRLRSSGKSDI